MKADERDCRKDQREMAEKYLKTVTTGKWIPRHLESVRSHIEAFGLPDRRQTVESVPIKAEKPEVLRRSQG